ncbi:MAG: M20/M25/M40 family metallo-hydrolase [Methanomassiliicoccales archaeon]|nr:M20/M25/M40 family metallo-hydrolase [Methanomassiliicoccales archaeon]
MRRSPRDRVIGKTTSTLLDLLLIDSDNHGDKSNIVRYTAGRLREFGMKVKIVGRTTDAPAIFATSGSRGLIFSGHLDTVPIGEGWRRGQGEIAKGRVYGRGTADMKGAIASMIHAAEDLTAAEVPCSIMLTTDEEERMLGAIKLSKMDELKDAPAIIICEPTGLDIAVKEKGVYRFRLVTHGRAAHSSQSWLGENAILKMHSLLGRLSDLAVTPRGPTDDLTMCFATTRGGTKNNVVPDRCEVEIDVRFPAPQTPDDIADLLKRRLGGNGYDIEVIYGLDAFKTDPGFWVVAEIKRFLGTKVISVPYATEAPRYVRANSSIYICGPGEPTMAHVVDEYVEIGKMERAHEMLIRLAKKAAQG